MKLKALHISSLLEGSRGLRLNQKMVAVTTLLYECLAHLFGGGTVVMRKRFCGIELL